MEIPYVVTPRKDTGLFNAKIAIWLFLASEVMLFGGFFSAYVFLRLGADYPWPERTLPVLPGLINTFVLIGSSVTVVFAWASLKMREWRRFQLFMGITVFCALIFMILKGIEYNVKFHHQAVRLKDYTVVEGHLGYEKEGERYVLDHNGRKIEENLIFIEASKLTFNPRRFHKPWIEELLTQAEHPNQQLSVVEEVKFRNSDGQEEVLFKANDLLSYATLTDALAKVGSGSGLIAVGDIKAKEVSGKDQETQSLLKAGQPLTSDWVKGVMARLNLARIVLASDVSAVTREKAAPEVIAKAGEPLSIELLSRIEKTRLAAASHNAAYRTAALRQEWVEAHQANPEKSDWQIASNVNIDLAALAPKLLDEVSSVTFKVDPPAKLDFHPRDIQEANGSSRLRDDTVVEGKLLESPMVFHNVDAIDFQHLAMKSVEKGVDPMVAIENSWLIKNNPFAKEAWEWNKVQVAKIEKELIAKYGIDRKTGKPNREPTLKERYRIGWQDFVSKANGVDREHAEIGIKEQFMGPDYAGREDKHTFPHLSVPREQVGFAAKFTPAWNTYYAIYFTITGLHGLHVIGGALVLAYYLFFGRKMYLTNPEWLANRVEIGGLFWHFVDLVWIFVFPILYLM